MSYPAQAGQMIGRKLPMMIAGKVFAGTQAGQDMLTFPMSYGTSTPGVTRWVFAEDDHTRNPDDLSFSSAKYNDRCLVDVNGGHSPIDLNGPAPGSTPGEFEDVPEKSVVWLFTSDADATGKFYNFGQFIPPEHFASEWDVTDYGNVLEDLLTNGFFGNSQLIKNFYYERGSTGIEMIPPQAILAALLGLKDAWGHFEFFRYAQQHMTYSHDGYLGRLQHCCPGWFSPAAWIQTQSCGYQGLWTNYRALFDAAWNRI
jgi:hypothetical protein